jgi:periodic tryptophan protein 1
VLLYCSLAPATHAADTTVKVWDVATQSCQHTLRHHSDKVQAVAWNPAEAPVLLSGGFDKKACLVSSGRMLRGPGHEWM